MPTKLQQDEHFLRKTLNLAKHSDCLRKRVACIVVKNGKILTQACNDPLTAYDCKKLGCIRNQMKVPHGHRREICYGICAEMYAIARIAQSGKSCKGATIYVTIRPCRVCEGIISQSGIARVVYAGDYPCVLPINTLRDHNIETLHIPIQITQKEKKKHLMLDRKASKEIPKRLGKIIPPKK